MNINNGYKIIIKINFNCFIDLNLGNNYYISYDN